MTDDKLREVLSSIVDVELELIAAVESPSTGLLAGGHRLEKIRRELEPSSIGQLPGFQES
jgi:hypothetical protein